MEDGGGKEKKRQETLVTCVHLSPVAFKLIMVVHDACDGGWWWKRKEKKRNIGDMCSSESVSLNLIMVVHDACHNIIELLSTIPFL